MIPSVKHNPMMPVTDRIRILIIQANPPGTARLDSDIEQRKLDAALTTALDRDHFAAPIRLSAARIEDLPRSLRYHQPHILHFIGHGDGAGGLLLNAPDDQGSVALSAADLSALIGVYQAEAALPLRLILLAGCDTALAAQLLSQQVTCVIGTTDAILDSAVRDVLTPAFYAALGDGRSVGNALDAARAELRSQGYVDDAAIVIPYAQAGVDLAQLWPRQWLQSKETLSPAHVEYLTRWFSAPWATVSLADILHDRHDEARLLDLYVPLPVDFALTVKTKAGQIVDWWVAGDRGRAGDDEAAARNRVFAKNPVSELSATRRHWTDLGVDETTLTPLIAHMQRRFDQEIKKEQLVDDGDHEQPPLAAHHAAALRTRFVLLGDPGSGKSSFLRHLALCLAGELCQRQDATVPVNANLAVLGTPVPAACTPIYIEMRALVSQAFPPLPVARTTSASSPTIEMFWRYVREQLLPGALLSFETVLLSLVRNGDAILLLDGLDEVPQSDDGRRRQQIKALINALTQSYPTLPIIVTSRPYAYHAEDWSLAGFGHTRLQPLGLEQLRALAQALFASASSPEPVEGDDAEAFVNAVRNHPNMEPSLHANPLFFTLLTALWLADERRQFSATQAELYRRAVDLLLDKWTQRRAPEPSVAERLHIDPAQLRPILERLACTVHEQRQAGEDPTRFRTSRLLDEIEDANLHLNAQDVAEYLERHAGLFISPQRGHFYFSHRSFQEHLAACELTCRDPKRTPPVAANRYFPDGLIRRVFDQPALWRNVALLASDELMRQEAADELWALLDELCRPYLEEAAHPTAALMALTIAQRHDLFALDLKAHRNRPIKYAYDELLQVAHRVLTDNAHFAPAERNIAGELLGRRPEHDTRPGVGCRANGLPDIDWVKIPETDDQGRREFIYQKDEIRTEPTFWMARYPVTYGQFQAFLDAEDGFTNLRWWEGLAAPEDAKAEPGEQAFKFWNHPRERVSWYDAIAFCRWLTDNAKSTSPSLPAELQGRSDWRITLPTEWQWEKAARGFDGRRYPWGEEYVSDYANINETTHKDDSYYLQKTSAVGMYPLNCSPFDIEDMSGNVWEYCLNERINPARIQETGGANRVVRGGSWFADSTFASTLNRLNGWNHRNLNYGFRVVVGLFAVPVL